MKRAFTRRLPAAFTLIELMIVIAIIAVIAAIAIPGLLAAQRAANERAAAASAKCIATAQADFRSNDRNNDRAQNFWTGDIYGLFALCPSTNGANVPAGADIAPERMIKLIEPALASADGNVSGNTPGEETVANAVGSLAPKSSYIVRAFGTYAQGAGTSPYGVAGGIAAWGANYNFGKFAVMAFPASYGSGHQIFIMDETLTMFRADPGNAYTSTFTGGGTSTSTWSGSVGGAAVTEALAFPSSPGGSGWSKTD
jgi:prepilin-type N-terminal cleavage/methylation domain-containing protein